MSVRFAASVFLSTSLMWLSPVLAQPVPLGDDFNVAYFTTNPSEPSVAARADGTFVVVWTSLGSGTDTSGYGIRARLFDVDAQPLGFPIQVNSYTTDNQTAPAVALDGAGNFLVVWRSEGSPGSDRWGSSIQGQFFDAGGRPVDGQFQVNNFTPRTQANPSVAASAEGVFVVVWTSDEAPELSEAYRVHARRFDRKGPPQYQFEVTEERVSLRAPIPVVAVNSDGASLFSWNAGPNIYGRLYDPFGNALGHAFQVSTHTANYQRSPAIAADGLGNFVVVWRDIPFGSNFGNTRARRFDGVGTPIGREVGVGPETNEQGPPSVAADGEGNFVVVWERNSTPSSEDGSEIVGQLCDTLGKPVGDPFQVNSDARFDQTGPAIAADPSGILTVVWSRSSGSSRVDGRRFALPTTTSSSTTSTTLLAPVCGNGMVEAGEACDGGACCAPGCVLRGPSEPCGIETRPCHEQPVCNGREATCPELPRLSPEGSTCFNPGDNCIIGSCHQATASCEGQARVCAADSRVLNDGRVRKNGQPKVKIEVSCDANEKGDCEAAAFTASAAPQGAGALQTASEGEQITVAADPSRTRKKKKHAPLGFRTKLRLKLNARGRELLESGDLTASIHVTVHRGGVEHHQTLKFLNLLQLRH